MALTNDSSIERTTAEHAHIQSRMCHEASIALSKKQTQIQTQHI